jgi:hypothetical protein
MVAHGAAFRALVGQLGGLTVIDARRPRPPSPHPPGRPLPLDELALHLAEVRQRRPDDRDVGTGRAAVRQQLGDLGTVPLHQGVDLDQLVEEAVERPRDGVRDVLLRRRLALAACSVGARSGAAAACARLGGSGSATSGSGGVAARGVGRLAGWPSRRSTSLAAPRSGTTPALTLSNSSGSAPLTRSACRTA